MVRTLITCSCTVALLVSSLFASAINLYTYTNGGIDGPWNAPGTWTTDPTGATLVGSAIPANNDVVTVLNGFRVYLTANVSSTGLSITINNGGVLDLSTFTISTLSVFSGAGTLRIGAGYFPNVTTNNFLASAAAGATVQYYDFSGNIPTAIDFPNLTFSNSTGANHTMSFTNTAAETFTVFGNLTTSSTGVGNLTVRMGTQATNVLNLTIRGNLTIGVNTVLGAGVFSAIHSLSVEGNLTNNGTAQFSNSGQYSASANGAIHLTFIGVSDRNFSCAGLTNLYTLTVNKGTGSVSILSVTSTNSANLNFYSNGQLITISRGTLRLGANINVPRVYGSGTANYDLGSNSLSPMLWIDGATVSTNGAALVVYGKFRMTAGSFTSMGGQGTVIREEGQYLIEGGIFTTEKFRPSSTASTHRGTFIMTGGEFNAQGTTGSDGAYARFSLPYPEQVFIMSGGTINIRNSQTASGSLHIGSNDASYNVTGGTINVILSGTSANFPLLSTAALWNLNITRVAGATATAVSLSNIGSIAGAQNTARPLRVQNDFSIEGANSAVFNSNNLDVTIGGNFTIETGATYTSGNNTTLFNGASDQTFHVSGTITSGLNNLSVNKSLGTLTLAGTSPSIIVRSTLSLLNGIVNDGGKTVEARANIHNEAVHTGAGNITLNGSATQTISGDGTGVFGNVILNNSNTPGATLTADAAISGALTLAGAGNSLFDIGPYQLWLTSPATTALATTGAPFSSTKMIRTLGLQSDRGVRKSFGNLSPFTFHFGSGSDYTPATLQLTSAPATYGSLSVKPVNSRHPFVAVANTRNLSYYWKIVSDGFTGVSPGSVSHEFKYLPSKVTPPGDDVNYVPARYNASGWVTINDTGQVLEGTQSIRFAGVDYLDGDFTAGIPSSFGVVLTFYSIRNGLWSDANPATTPWSNQSHSGLPASSSPGANDQVIIGDGATFNHTVTINLNGRTTGALAINAGSTLDIGVTTGHDFGRLENVSAAGSGLMRISSATALAEFPAGDFGLFIRESGGGTVEYYTTGAQDFTIPLNSIAPTNLSLITYRNLVLAPGAGRTITMPDQDLRIYSNLIVQGLSSTGKVNLNAASSRALDVLGNLMVSEGNLQFQNGTAQSVVVSGDITIGVNGIFDISPSGTAIANELTVMRNIVNNGILDLSNIGSRRCNATFMGSSNSSITGSGTVTDFNVLRVNKGTTQTPVLNVNASAFSLSGGSLPLELIGGTFRLTSNQTVTIADGQIFNIPAATRLSTDGGTLQLTGGVGIDMRVSGTLEVLSGAVNVGTTSQDNSIEYAATGNPSIIVSGGTLNVNSQIRRPTASTQGKLNYSQSGSSTVTVGINSALSASRGVFEILNAGSSFSMTGGTLRILRPTSGTVGDLFLQPSSYTVTGGTIEVGTTTSSQVIDINTTIPLFNLSVLGTNNGARLDTNPLVLRGALTIANSNYFSANSLNVDIAGDFTNANTSATVGINTGGYRPGNLTQTTSFNGSSANQNISGVAGNLTNFANLVINNSFTGGSVNLQTNTQLRVNSSLTLTRGIFADGGNTATVSGNVLNSSTHTSAGTGSITLAGSSSQLMGGNGSGKFGNVVLNNSAGASFTTSQEITGVLTLTSGSMFINQHLLFISNPSLTAISGASSSRYIVTSGQLSNGGLRKAFSNSVINGNFIYPVGVVGKYTPANYTMSTGAAGGTITVKPVNSKHPGATGSGASFINYYWNVTSNLIVLTSLTHTYQYVAADEEGTPTEYREAHFRSGAWSIGSTAGNPDPVTRIITFTNIDPIGDYTAGEPTAFVNPTTYISIASGNWESDDSIWDQDPPGTSLGPPAGSFVVISEGHTIIITTNTKRPATLDVRGRLHIGTTTGHDFGTVSCTGTGERTIQIQSSTFPSGDFSTFTAANGGTVDFSGTLTLPTQNVYNNVVFTGTGVKVLPNADLTLNGNLTVFSGTVDNSVNNRNVTLVSSSGDFTNNGGFNSGAGAITVARDLINSGSFTGPGGGPLGLSVGGNITNTGGAVFTAMADPVVVMGDIVNDATILLGNGGVDVAGSVSNTGDFTTGTGALSIIGSLTNNGSYTAGTGAISVGTSFTNSGASAVYSSGGNTLEVAGSFNNLGSATFNAQTGTTIARGNWTNLAVFSAGSGTVNFGGAAVQALTGSTTFHNVIRSNGGSLTLSSNITIGGMLTLGSGNIVTGSNQVSLTNTSTQPVVGQNISSFIDGSLAISFPNTSGSGRIFPVGKNNTYRPVAIYQNAVSANPVVNVEMINSPPVGTYPVTIQGLSEARYFKVNLTSGTMNSPVVELSFNTNAPVDENIAIPGNVRIVRSTAPTGPWTDEGGTGVFSPASPAGYATSDLTSVQNPTYFALAYQNTPLPILLGSFDALFSRGAVQVNWTTLSEWNNAFFTVERSVGGLEYDSVLVAPGAGYSNAPLHYEEVDYHPLPGISYYRLKQTDFDGVFVHSKPVRVVNPEGAARYVDVYPNPAGQQDDVFLKMVRSGDTNAHVALASATGEVYFEGNIDLAQPVNLMSLLGRPPARGMYILHVNAAGMHESIKVLLY